MKHIHNAVNHLQQAIDLMDEAQKEMRLSCAFANAEQHIQFIENYKDSIKYQLLDCVTAWRNAINHELGMKEDVF
jgi:hypothetical protein